MKPGSPWIFFLLVFLLSLPAYGAGLVPPYSLVMVFNPFLAAVILIYREQGAQGVKRLIGRSIDYARISHKVWYVPLLFLMPLTMLLEYAWLRITGVSPALQFPALMMPLYFLVFFILAIGEEVGWSGYAIDPLQDRWCALPAAILLGLVWALWHLVPYLLANPPLWVVGQCTATVMIRILMVWLYNNTGHSVFGMILFNAMINMSSIPNYGFAYDLVIISVILAIMVMIVAFVWGPRTLSRSYKRPP